MMRKLTFIILAIFLCSLAYSQNCCFALDSDFNGACLDDIPSCTAGTTPCDDATFDALFYPSNWSFFECTSGCATGSCPGGYFDYSTLPVELFKFYAKIENKYVNLFWSTASETNNEKFEIEESHNGREFYKIGEVKGSGTTTQPKDYSFTIGSKRNGISYYRLKQVDYDGGYEYSKILSVRVDENATYRIYPNPTTDVLHISHRSNYRITNSLGQVVTRGTAKRIDVSKFPAGLYLIRLGNGDVKQFVKR